MTRAARPALPHDVAIRNRTALTLEGRRGVLLRDWCWARVSSTARFTPGYQTQGGDRNPNPLRGSVCPLRNLLRAQDPGHRTRGRTLPTCVGWLPSSPSATRYSARRSCAGERFKGVRRLTLE